MDTRRALEPRGGITDLGFSSRMATWAYARARFVADIWGLPEIVQST